MTLDAPKIRFQQCAKQRALYMTNVRGHGLIYSMPPHLPLENVSSGPPLPLENVDSGSGVVVDGLPVVGVVFGISAK